MRLDPDQLEWIVGEVVRRLRGESAEPAPNPPADLKVTETVVTAATLEHRLDGVARVSIGAGAVITPSARDLLRERRIELLRT